MDSPLIIDGELVLYGYVGGEAANGWGFSALDVVEALAEMDGDIVVRLNSGGGSAWDGIAIYNALKGYSGGAVQVKVDAIAASAASVIAMAGARISVPASATVMIHNASVITWGDRAEHERSTNLLKGLDRQIAGVYADRTGVDADDLAEMMDAETWLTGEECVLHGFADDHGDDQVETPAEDDEAEATNAAAPSPFAYDIYSRTPERVAACAAPDDHREFLRTLTLNPRAVVSHTRTSPAFSPAARAAPQPMEAPLPRSKTPAAPQTVAPTDDNAIALAATNAERARSAGIRKAVKAAKLDVSVADDLIEQGVSLDTARERVIDLMADGDDDEIRPAARAQVTADGGERWGQGVQLALMARAGLDGGERNEFSSLSLLELARTAVTNSGARVTGHDRMAIAGAALNPLNHGGSHSSSDFANICGNIARLSMLRGYGEAPETFERFTARGTLGDFKTATRIDAGMFPNLDLKAEGAEYSFATVSDRKVQLALATYGKKFSLTREAIINDDLDAFSRLPRKMGRAARRTVGNLVWAVITANGAMPDGTALFHGDHNNLAAGGDVGAPTVSNVTAAKAAMAKQKDADAIASALNIRPAYMLAPVALEGVAQTLISSETDPSKSNSKVPNIHRSTLEVVTDARLDVASATAWYLAADPNVADTLEVSYLDGEDQPVLEQRMDWDTDGIAFKVRIDAGVTPMDHRGLYKNAGA